MRKPREAPAKVDDDDWLNCRPWSAGVLPAYTVRLEKPVLEPLSWSAGSLPSYALRAEPPVRDGWHLADLRGSC